MNVLEIANNNLALWNEPNADVRGALISRTFTANANYVDPLMRGRSMTALTQ
jgi:hypothetical protein